jgi:hypothetical protein
VERRGNNISDHYVIIARIRQGIFNARNKYGAVLGILTVTERLRLASGKDLNISDTSLTVSVNDTELGSNDSLGEDKEGKV